MDPSATSATCSGDLRRDRSRYPSASSRIHPPRRPTTYRPARSSSPRSWASDGDDRHEKGCTPRRRHRVPRPLPSPFLPARRPALADVHARREAKRGERAPGAPLGRARKDILCIRLHFDLAGGSRLRRDSIPCPVGLGVSAVAESVRGRHGIGPLPRLSSLVIPSPGVRPIFLRGFRCPCHRSQRATAPSRRTALRHSHRPGVRGRARVVLCGEHDCTGGIRRECVWIIMRHCLLARLVRMDAMELPEGGGAFGQGRAGDRRVGVRVGVRAGLRRNVQLVLQYRCMLSRGGNRREDLSDGGRRQAVGPRPDGFPRVDVCARQHRGTLRRV